MKQLTVKPIRTEEQCTELAGALLSAEDCITLVGQEDTTVYKEDGSVLCIYRPKVLSPKNAKAAYKNLKSAATMSQGSNRGAAAGKHGYKVGDIDDYGRVVGKVLKNGLIYRPLKEDGTVSNSNYSRLAPSGIVGYFNRTARFPYCRTTAFNLHHGHSFQQAIPFIREIDTIFAESHPERYNKQRAMADKTERDFLISDTAFTTVTVNANWQTAVHKDIGDYEEGFGVMTAVRTGNYKGCHLVFPKYGVGVDMQNGGVLLADVHEWHGNTPIVGLPNDFERISFVLYYREGMQNCGTAEYELSRAKNRKAGEPLIGVK